MRFIILCLMILPICSYPLFSMKQKEEKVVFDKNVIKKLPQEVWIYILGFACDCDTTNLQLISKQLKDSIDKLAESYYKSTGQNKTNNFSLLSKSEKQMYRFLAFVDLKKKGTISSHAFLHSLKNDSHMPFTFVLTRIPVYDSSDHKKIYKKPYEKYMNFILSKVEKKYALIDDLIESFGFKKICCVLFRHTPFYFYWDNPGMVNDQFTCYPDDLFTIAKDSDLEVLLRCVNPMITHIEVHSGKWWALENPDKYKLVKEYGKPLSKEFGQDPEGYFQELKKSYWLMRQYEMDKN